ncbi:MAG: hypothetical protein WB341_07135 [Terracidiphilus sp.]
MTESNARMMSGVGIALLALAVIIALLLTFSVYHRAHEKAQAFLAANPEWENRNVLVLRSVVGDLPSLVPVESNGMLGEPLHNHEVMETSTHEVFEAPGDPRQAATLLSNGSFGDFIRIPLWEAVPTLLMFLGGIALMIIGLISLSMSSESGY